MVSGARLYYYYSLMEENSHSNLIFKRLEPLIDPNRLQLLTQLWWRFLVLDNSRYTAWQTRESCEAYFENVRQALSLSQDLRIRAFDELNLAFGAHAALVEEFYQHLMVFYARMELKAEAAAVFQRCQTTLMESLGIEPSGQTQRLYQSLFQ